MQFPSNPDLGQEYSIDNRTWRFNGVGWQLVSNITLSYDDLTEKPGLVTSSDDGFMSSEDKTKLDGIENNATSNSSDSYLLDRTNHIGTQSISTIEGLNDALLDKLDSSDTTSDDIPEGNENLYYSDGRVRGALLSGLSFMSGAVITATDTVLSSFGKLQKQISDLLGNITTHKTSDDHDDRYFTKSEIENSLSNKVDTVEGKGLSSEDYTQTEKTKLENIEDGATANSSDSYLLDRSNHTGTMPIEGVEHLSDSIESIHMQLANAQMKEPGYGLSQEDYSPAEKTKLAGIEPGAQVNPVPVDELTSTSTELPLSANQGKVLKDFIDSINTLLQSDDETLDELQEIVDFVKLNRADLDSLSINSIAGLSDALENKQPLSNILTNTTASFTTTLLNKLNSIAANATANATDAHLLNRSNHTGTQPISTITDLQTTLNNKVDSVSGKTGVVTLDKSDVGLGNVDNTSDINKPVSNPVLVRFGGASTTSGTLDWNEHTQPGIGNVLLLGSNANGPGNGQYYFVWNLEYGSGRSGNGNITQIAIPYTNQASINGGVFWFRGRYSGEWTDWERTFTTITPPTISEITGLQSTLDNKASTSVATTSANGLMSSADKSKLNGIATGATSNASDAHLLNRANHTGTQPISSIVDLQNILNNKVDAEAGKGLSTEDFTTEDKNKIENIPNVTISTSDPSGGIVGDIWFKV